MMSLHRSLQGGGLVDDGEAVSCYCESTVSFREGGLFFVLICGLFACDPPPCSGLADAPSGM